MNEIIIRADSYVKQTETSASSTTLPIKSAESAIHTSSLLNLGFFLWAINHMSIIIGKDFFMNFCPICSSAEIIKLFLMVTIVKEMFVKGGEIFYVDQILFTGVLPYNDQGEILYAKDLLSQDTAWTLPAGF